MRKHGTPGRKASAKTLRLRSTQRASERRNEKHATARAPCYDRERRELRVGKIVVKSFTQASDAQEMILLAFQEENWPRRLDDPLTGKAGQDHKQRLRTAVANLNRRQSMPLLRFHVIWQATGIAWELRETSDSRAT